MFVLEQELIIGAIKFPLVAETIMESSREIPTDVLNIKLPRYRNLKSDSIQKFAKVEWKAGYKQYGLFPEFCGYVLEVSQNIPLEIKCVDPFFFCQRKTMTRNYSNESLLAFLNDCIHPQIKSDISILIRDEDIKKTVSIECAGKSARFALSILKVKYGVDVFFHDWKLVVQKAFVHTNLFEKSKNKRIQKSQNASASGSPDPVGEFPVFRVGFNIIQDDLNAREKKDIKITVRGEDPKTGTTYKGSYGTGEERFFEVDGLDRAGAEKRAKELFMEHCGSGFNGKFLTFGYPSVTHSQVIHVIDLDHPSRTAKSFVEKVTKTFGMNGYRQEIWPGFFFEPPKKSGSKPPKNESKFRNDYTGPQP
ncbi:hypothetical protein LEP1GSC034_0997 [Leptospira interrogans str. 2003000735]|uniref:Uncharacterized protein n=2 Tax=Leptospira interrogans TaxID=173 RepID=A0A829DBS2_LEPIR|nr:hypothetical protein [Leptospira interrogans]EMY06279.1 hypothetical protein LEP1GSC029_3134 [Leptospira interrogans str. 2002000626]EKN89905.1 hypothetical protein LEP1GSC027_3948 [Leptospira interrogans str. 2002000624]EKQ40225.1 hypothetical protein LEP1GSC025_2143 [Leptospira interrogans str. 2002000621]EKQ46079.1 hypothetical protein LEP1GSC026_3142 [Leptospira interrogans str. 2002000623]EMJ68718.1 hypothetical protein LEP1GSC034_0795 [Leptospira interrogans str. 2003000735]